MEVPDELERLEEGPVQPHQRRVRRLGTQARVAAHCLARLQIILWSLCWLGEPNNEVLEWVLPQILGAVSDEYDNTYQPHGPLRIHLAVRRPPDMLLQRQQQQEEEQYVIEIFDHIHTSGAPGNGLPPDLLAPESRAGPARFGIKRLDWSKLTVGFSFSVAAQMSINILQSGGQSVPSSSDGSAKPRHSDPVVMFQCVYGYPLAILSCLGFITVGHLIGGVKKFPPWVAAVATKSGIFMGGVGFVLALTAAFPNHLKYVTWACCAAFILAVFICRYNNHSRVC